MTQAVTFEINELVKMLNENKVEDYSAKIFLRIDIKTCDPVDLLTRVFQELIEKEMQIKDHFMIYIKLTQYMRRREKGHAWNFTAVKAWEATLMNYVRHNKIKELDFMFRYYVPARSKIFFGKTICTGTEYINFPPEDLESQAGFISMCKIIYALNINVQMVEYTFTDIMSLSPVDFVSLIPTEALRDILKTKPEIEDVDEKARIAKIKSEFEKRNNTLSTLIIKSDNKSTESEPIVPKVETSIPILQTRLVDNSIPVANNIQKLPENISSVTIVTNIKLNF